MTNDNDLKDIEQDVFRDTMRDGLIEILAGFLLILLPAIIYQPSFIAFFVAFYIILLPQMIEPIRQKYTYPRIGYVKPRVHEIDLNPKAFLILLVAIVLFGGIATLLMTGNVLDIVNWLKMIPFMMGMFMLGPSSYLVEKTGLKTYWVFGAATTVLGLLISYLTIIIPPQGLYDGVIAFSMMLGAGLLVMGIITYVRFTRNNPVIATQEDTDSES